MRKKVLVRGPVLSQSGYGEHARMVLRSLQTVEDDIDIFIVPIGWGQTGWIHEKNEFRDWLDSRIAVTALAIQNKEKFDLSIQISIPNEFEKLAPVNIGVTAGIETTKVSSVWLQKCNEMNKIIVPSNFAKWGFDNTIYQGQDQHGNPATLKLQVPIEVIPYPVRGDVEAIPDFADKLDLSEDDFAYILVGQWGPRKNMDNAIRWWLEENWEEDVVLVVKTSHRRNNIMDREFTQNRLSALLRSVKADPAKRKCSLKLLHGDMSEAEMKSLYAHPAIKCMVTATHGEGFGLPLFEFAQTGKLIVAPGWSAHLDFLTYPNEKGEATKGFLEVDYTISPVQKEAVWDGIILSDSAWSYPLETSYKQRVRQARTKFRKWEPKLKQLSEHIKKTFTKESVDNKIIQTLGDYLNLGEPKKNEIIENYKEISKKIKPKERLEFLKRVADKLKTQEEKLELFKDSMKGESVYVLSCGPSLMRNDMNKLKQLIKNKPVISIKQAFDYFKQETDIHIYNCANYKKYDYDSTKKPVIIEASTFPDPIAPCDLKFQIRVRDFKDSVSKLKNYEDWTFVKNKFERPYGPGIETELLIYLLEHLGFSEAITVGWDNKIVGDTSQNQHFYSGDEKEKPLINDCSLVPFEKLKLEEQISLDAISDWYDWLTGKGCRIKICSDVNPAPSKIERVVI